MRYTIRSSSGERLGLLRILALLALLALVSGVSGGCSGGGPAADAGGLDGIAPPGDVRPTDLWRPPDVAPGSEAPPPPPASCGFDYATSFTYPLTKTSSAPGGAGQERWSGPPVPPPPGEIDRIAHAEPPPPFYYRLSLLSWLWPEGRTLVPVDDLVMPGYVDSSPLFSRAGAWSAPTRCYETPRGAEQLTEGQAYDLYRAIAEQTTGVPMSTAAEVRSVVGLRGAYPGTFAWNDNLPDRFNDTLVLLWIDAAGTKHAREFAAHTDTGPHDFGYHASSSLRPNRRYRYINGHHNAYDALRIDETGYRVRDDGNKNGHWDSDRNGWMPPDTPGLDHDRAGSLHNIHTAPLEHPLGQAPVRNYSAGCQVIPGHANWVEFLTNAWTTRGAKVDYFLVDVRDIAPAVWSGCAANGTHDCPYLLTGMEPGPARPQGDTSRAGASSRHAGYGCSAADLSGPEEVFVVTTDKTRTLSVSLESAPGAAHELLLLDADDPRSCLAASQTAIAHELTPGRYVIIVETRANAGAPLSGPFRLTASWK